MASVHNECHTFQLLLIRSFYRMRGRGWNATKRLIHLAQVILGDGRLSAMCWLQVATSKRRICQVVVEVWKKGFGCASYPTRELPYVSIARFLCVRVRIGYPMIPPTHFLNQQKGFRLLYNVGLRAWIKLSNGTKCTRTLASDESILYRGFENYSWLTTGKNERSGTTGA